MKDTIEIYTDGACRGNQFNDNIGGYAIILLYNNYRKEISKAFKNTTNNRMELLAVVEGLKAIKDYTLPTILYSDSQYVINTINLGWKRNIHLDLWEEFDNLRPKFTNISFIKVKGHSNNKYNNEVDALVNKIMDNLKKIVQGEGD